MKNEALLFDDKEEENGVSEKPCALRINKEFAEKYNTQKRREAIKNASLTALDVSTDDDSSSEEEDSDAELLTKNVQEKIVTTISRIRAKDPQIYDSSARFFTDDDFCQHEEKPSKSKPLTFSTFMSRTLTKDGATAFTESSELPPQANALQHKKKTFEDEQRELKEAFLNAAEGEDQDDLFCVAEKTAEEQADDDLSFQEFLKKRATSSKDDSELLKRYLHDDEQLNDGDKFLRDYVLFEGWKEGNRMPQGSSKPIAAEDNADVDEEDARHLQEAAQFEALYNFRFEETPCPSIQGHARKVYDSVRQTEDRRRRQRLDRQERKQQEKEAKKKELERLKRLKQEEILERLKVIQRIAGTSAEIDPEKINLDSEFNEKTHEEEMQAILGDDYEQKAEEQFDQLESTAAEFQKLADFNPSEYEGLSAKQRKKLERMAKKRAKLNRYEAGEEAYAPLPEGANQETSEQTELLAHDEPEEDVQNNMSQVSHVDEEGNHMWYLCDGCNFGIPARKKRYECTRCEDFVLCSKCFRSVRHPHRLVARRVPENCKPPSEFLWQKASTTGTTPPTDLPDQIKAELDAALDEYYALDYEDIVAGMPVRFKYTQTPQEDFGLTTDTILRKTDAELNSMVSLKQYAPYRKRSSAKHYQMQCRKRPFNKPSIPVSSPAIQKQPTENKHSYRKKWKPDVLTSPAPEHVPEDRLAAYGLSNTSRKRKA